MSSPRRRKELQELRYTQLLAEEAEQNRVAGLSMWERIYEIKDIEDVKAVLNLMREKLEME